MMHAKLTLLLLLQLGWIVAACGSGPETVPEAPVVTPLAESPKTSTEITDGQRVKMVFVPAGEFLMGSETGDVDERPIRSVFLDAFYIDMYEVTNARYRLCVDAGLCLPPAMNVSSTRANYYDDPAFDDYPVMYVSWEMAQSYCAWRGVELPTEAQWEKAARGTDGRTYPWGEGIDCQRANYYRQQGTDFIACVGDTTRVGSYESGQSPYGAYDLTGNVWEWVSDWYGSSYYQESPVNNPTGPESGSARVVRGGAWQFSDFSVRATRRYWFNPSNALENVGFRCARKVGN
jgi:formylglycine-generating enzyme required for sulfatase activity